MFDVAFVAKHPKDVAVVYIRLLVSQIVPVDFQNLALEARLGYGGFRFQGSHLGGFQS